ncbi:MAG: HAMP domain-containing histidine kinase [Leptospiraceae bacterium]|nr:HAMP domain-containing histidine kinase [Leptospiraceae bacterium]
MQSRNFFFKTPVLLVFVFLLGVVNVIWYNVTIARSIDSLARSEFKSVEKDILHGITADPVMLQDMVQKRRIIITDQCQLQPCLSLKNDKHKFAQIDPGYAEGLNQVGASRNRMLWYETAIMVIVMLAGSVYMIVILLSERKDSEEREQFIAMVTHELKHPISSVSLLLESIQRGTVKGDTLKKFITRGLEEIRSLKIQLDNLMRIQDLSVFAIDENDIYPVADFIGNLIEHERANRTDSEKRLHFFNEISNNKYYISKNRRGLQTVLVNLIDNALKYSSREVEISVFTQRGKAVIEVRDYGVGFSKEDRRRAPEMFYRSPRYQIQNIKGTGLGLFTTYRLAELMKIRIELISEGEDQGSVFRLII